MGGGVRADPAGAGAGRSPPSAAAQTSRGGGSDTGSLGTGIGVKPLCPPLPPSPSPYLCHGEGRSADDPAEEGSSMESQLHQLQDGHRHLPSPFPPPAAPARPPPPHPTPHGAGLRRGPIAAAPSYRRCHRRRVCRGGWWSHSALWLSHPPPAPCPKRTNPVFSLLGAGGIHPSLHPSFPPSIPPSTCGGGAQGDRQDASWWWGGGAGCVPARECHQRRYRRDFTWTATTHQPAPSLLGSARQREPRRPTPPHFFPQRDGHRPSPATPAAGVQRPTTPRHLQTLRTEQPTTFY